MPVTEIRCLGALGEDVSAPSDSGEMYGPEEQQYGPEEMPAGWTPPSTTDWGKVATDVTGTVSKIWGSTQQSQSGYPAYQQNQSYYPGQPQYIYGQTAAQPAGMSTSTIAALGIGGLVLVGVIIAIAATR
jgi:hypothetical protein